MNKHYVLFYDICDNKRRNRIVKVLEDYGYRIQYSVFEMTIPESKLMILKEEVLNILNKDEDSFKIYELDEPSWNKRQSFGNSAILQSNDNYSLIL